MLAPVRQSSPFSANEICMRSSHRLVGCNSGEGSGVRLGGGGGKRGVGQATSDGLSVCAGGRNNKFLVRNGFNETGDRPDVLISLSRAEERKKKSLEAFFLLLQHSHMLACLENSIFIESPVFISSKRSVSSLCRHFPLSPP